MNLVTQILILLRIIKAFLPFPLNYLTLGAAFLMLLAVNLFLLCLTVFLAQCGYYLTIKFAMLFNLAVSELIPVLSQLLF